MKISRFLFISLAFTFAPFLSATESSVKVIGCAEGLVSLYSHMEAFPDIEDPESLLSANKKSARTTVAFGESDNGQIVLHRIGDKWASVSTSHIFDPQGDPRWIVELLGTKRAAEFGFEIINDTTMKAPTAERFNRAVDAQLKKDPALKEAIRYYEFLGQSNTTEYLRRFIDNGEIPMDTSNANHYSHDISFHSGAIFLPNKLVEYSKEASKFTLALSDALIQMYRSDPNKADAAKNWAYFIRLNQVALVDATTGSVSAYALSAKKSGFDNPEVFKGLYESVELNTSYSKSLNRQIDRGIMAKNESDLTPRLIRSISEMKEQIPAQVLKNFIRDFTDQWVRDPNNSGFNPDRAFSLTMSSDEFCNEVSSRLRSFIGNNQP